MILYSASKAKFVEDVKANRIARAVASLFKQRFGQTPGQSELAAFHNSLNYMGNLLDHDGLRDDIGIAIEYRIPQSAKRIDFLITGKGIDQKSAVVIIELKQWTIVEATGLHEVVRTVLGGGKRDVPHPSYQSWSYAQFLRDFNSLVYEQQIGIHPCAYLHNCVEDGAVRHSSYEDVLSKAPVFLNGEDDQLRLFISERISTGDRCELIYQIDQAKIRPSKSLTSHLSKLLKGKKEFTLIDEQKVCYEMGLSLASRVERGVKDVLIVKGGPGTGKSVVAINLLVELTNRRKLVHYATRNSAPREVYQSILSGTLSKTRIANLFKNTGFYHDAEPDSFDAIIVDEAHRAVAKSGMFKNKGENQIQEIINAARLSIFFLDEDQRVTFSDIGSREEILKWAKAAKAEVVEMELPSQFRCNGSDGYLAWLDQALQIRETANDCLEGVDYDFQVCDSPQELRELIEAKNGTENTARLVAGYCWDWISKKDSKKFDISFPKYNFNMKWNLADDGQLWLLKKDSIDQIGCIHTCQGLELGYVGVIIGPDLIVRDGEVLTVPKARSKNDSSIKGYQKMRKTNPLEADRVASAIIKNTYRTLMTRGQKGCFVWAVDFETNLWMKHFCQITQSSRNSMVAELGESK